MNDRGPPEPSKSPRPLRERSLALPRWFVSQAVAPTASAGADRPLGESFPVVVALAFCALGVCLTVIVIGRITGATRSLSPPHRAHSDGLVSAVDGGRS